MVVSGMPFGTVAEIIHIAPVQIMLTLEVWSESSFQVPDVPLFGATFNK